MSEYVARPYHDDEDWMRLTTFLAACYAEVEQTHYLHVGDLIWQVFHMLANYKPSDPLHLWEDRQGHLLGFVLVYPDFGFFDLLPRPDQRGTPLEEEMLAWAHTFFQTRRQSSSLDNIYMLVNEHDSHRQALLEQHGYRRGEAWLYMQSPLHALAPTRPLAADFHIRSVVERDAAERATVLAAAYDAQVHIERYRRFMHAPGYVPHLDVVAVAPDGRFGAFAMCWVDTNTGVGQFEPVGTAPPYRRHGLGAAVLAEGARRMRLHGADKVIVIVEEAAEAAVTLYRSVGLLPSWKLYLYGTTS